MVSELSSYATEVFGQAGLPEKPDYPLIFVAPLGESVPEDGVFTYTTINNLTDLHNVAEHSVILWTEQQTEMLRVFSSNGALFGRSPQPLFGVPGATYLSWFDDATFGLERIAYGAYVSELRAAAEVAGHVAELGKSGTDVERERFSKANGTVRYNMDISTDDSDVDE